jgi:butyryl-CoA dehydrogenase/short/branched chain acyl-CoA dehydrogenase
VINALQCWGSTELRHAYLPKLASTVVGAYALSEAGSGSDAFALGTRATARGDQWLLSGRKLWITNAFEAGVFIVFATVDPAAGYHGITAFVVERGATGLSLGKKEDKLGIRARSTCEVILEDCRVPKKKILGDIRGYKVAIETLNEGRIGIGAWSAFAGGVARPRSRHGAPPVRKIDRGFQAVSIRSPAHPAARSVTAPRASRRGTPFWPKKQSAS